MNKAQQMQIIVTPSKRQKMIEYGVPSHMHEGIVRYVEQGVVPGDFLQAVINNDLKRACMFADDHNKDRLHCFVMWFYNQAPSGCWGHENAVRDWCRPIPEGEVA